MAIIEYEDRIKDIVNKANHDDFIFEFLSVYEKIAKSTITKLRNGTNNLAKNPGEVYLKNKLFFKKTSNDLISEYSKVEEYIKNIKSKPRYIIVTNFKKLLAKDTLTKDSLDIKFKQLPKYFEFFLAWNGIEKADFEKENPADIKAAEYFARIYDQLLNDNREVSRHGFNLFLIRLLFCLFAEDTGIFKDNAFTDFLKMMTSEDGSDMSDRISELFQFLDRKDRTGNEPAYLLEFPYVNGQLFTVEHEKMKFTKKTRKSIIDAGELIGWSKVNPDILGSMLQAVASEDKRSHLGMHYTSVPNIMKVIKPLFLDKLYDEFEKSKGNENKLNILYNRIGNIKFMDPACGSGNFLIIAYKKLRQLEIDIIKELNKMGIATMYVPSVTLNQFFGIEIDDFACDVTRLSLWIMEHQMNKKLENEIHDAVRPTLPLQKAGAIICGNSLRINWNKILPHKNKDEIYLFGNPPYEGAKKQSNDQKEDLRIASDGSKYYKKLDYISGWFFKGARYIHNSKAKIGFVTTNSINQGEQVSLLWTSIYKYAKIFFAHQSFKWKNNAKANASVTVSIIGLECNQCNSKKFLYSKNTIRTVKNISPYLVDSNSIVVSKRSTPLTKEVPAACLGSLPLDGGNLIFNDDEFRKAILDFPNLKKIFKKFIGSRELINGSFRYVLWMNKNDFKKFKTNEIIKDRITKVYNFRKKGKKSARDCANTPYQFFTYKRRNEAIMSHNEEKNGEMNTIVIPRVSSENRYYVPMGFVGEDTIVSDSATAIYDAPMWLFGILESNMHMVWIKSVAGRLKTDYRYSANIVYNTFPIPNLSTNKKNRLSSLALNLLDVRDEEGGTLASLYGRPLAEKNSKPMNKRLLDAHKKLDDLVDKLYKNSGFNNDDERLSQLLDMYSKKIKEEK